MPSKIPVASNNVIDVSPLLTLFCKVSSIAEPPDPTTPVTCAPDPIPEPLNGAPIAGTVPVNAI